MREWRDQSTDKRRSLSGKEAGSSLEQAVLALVAYVLEKLAQRF